MYQKVALTVGEGKQQGLFFDAKPEYTKGKTWIKMGLKTRGLKGGSKRNSLKYLKKHS